jgi:hypothetical protein
MGDDDGKVRKMLLGGWGMLMGRYGRCWWEGRGDVGEKVFEMLVGRYGRCCWEGMGDVGGKVREILLRG